ncbi:hypothetical protein [Crocosphaera chwakensis]|uniref:Uncharacterized protein n=1 Tax=Crocosphaera chwakensis CCY0110 TaxID=391612 RepID=A3IXT0_9CHRO|nr:hypothetical protein [Crocosphaera chwakensis]EAZ88733.1 hypothetical protein CY0110_01200 [Crocosphaera chwakensis CCY0110]
MSETKTNQTWITSKSIAIAARIPHNLYNQIEAYGMTHFAKGEGKYDKTATIIDLITKGLGLDGVSQSVQQSVNQQDLEQLVKQTVTQELEKTVAQNDIQNVKQELLESVKQFVQQSVNKSPESLEYAISHHPTIQSMKTHIDSLDHYLDGLTKAIQELKELKPHNQPIEEVKEENTVIRDDSLEDTPKIENENIPLSEVVETNHLPHEETEFDSSLSHDEEVKKAISKVRKLTVTQLQQIMKQFNSLKGKTVFTSRDYSQSRKRRKTNLIIDVLTREKENQVLMIQAIQKTLNS